MTTTLSHPCRLTQSDRRAEVRRLYFRHRLPLLHIARKLGISKCTAWRDVRWWNQRRGDEVTGVGCREGSLTSDGGSEASALSRHPSLGTSSHSDESHDTSSLSEESPSSRKRSLEDLNLEIEDLKEEAWRAYARSLEPQEVETETSAETESGADETPRRILKRVRKPGCGDLRYLMAIGKLIREQVTLFHTGENDIDGPPQNGPRTIVYLPDNGRGPQPYDPNPEAWRHRKANALKPDETKMKWSEGAVIGDLGSGTSDLKSVIGDSKAGEVVSVSPDSETGSAKIAAIQAPAANNQPPVTDQQSPATNPQPPTAKKEFSPARVMDWRRWPDPKPVWYIPNEVLINHFSEIIGKEPRSLSDW